jgi:peptidoglycan/xylan/chitin deacetylase (PgdA/CDA1 family)
MRTIQKVGVLREGIRAALFAKTVRMRNQRPIVSFTFDDFPKSAVSNGAKILEKHGIRGTYYVTGAFCDQVVDGVAQYRAVDLFRLVSAGHEIGCHTFSHKRVSMLNARELKKEIDLNAEFLVRHLPNTAMHTFAYPSGDVSFSATLNLQRIFASCRSIKSGLNTSNADLGRLRAVRLYDVVIDHNAIYSLIQQTIATNSWLIFYTHDVNEKPSRFGCSPGLFEHAVKTAVSAKAEVLPISDAVTEICRKG